MFQNILICTDGSERATKAVRTAALLAKQNDARVTLLHVRQSLINLEPFPGAPPTSALPTLEGYVRDRQKAVLAKSLPLVEEAGVACTVYEEVGDPADTITRVAEQRGCDLIVIGSRGLSLTDAAHLGSVAYSVVHNAHCPVLVVR